MPKCHGIRPRKVTYTRVHTQTHTNNFHARSAFVEYVMRQLNTSTFDSGEQLARVAEDRLKRIAGANQSSLLMDLMRHGDCRHKDLQEKVIFVFLCVCVRESSESNFMCMGMYSKSRREYAKLHLFLHTHTHRPRGASRCCGRFGPRLLRCRTRGFLRTSPSCSTECATGRSAARPGTRS